MFFSSHILPDVEAICDRVAIIHKGRIVALGSVEELKQLHTDGGGRLEDVFLALVGSLDEAAVLEVLREERSEDGHL